MEYNEDSFLHLASFHFSSDEAFTQVFDEANKVNIYKLDSLKIYQKKLSNRY